MGLVRAAAAVHISTGRRAGNGARRAVDMCAGEGVGRGFDPLAVADLGRVPPPHPVQAGLAGAATPIQAPIVQVSGLYPST